MTISVRVSVRRCACVRMRVTAPVLPTDAPVAVTFIWQAVKFSVPEEPSQRCQLDGTLLKFGVRNYRAKGVFGSSAFILYAQQVSIGGSLLELLL